jgi:NADH-quinone oxidoreductase subunit M
VGIIYERTHSREIFDNAGLGKITPAYVGFLGLFSISSLAFPGTNNFVGELYILIGTFIHNKVAGFCAVVGAILAAAYMLRLLKQITWGREDKRAIKDMNVREFIYLIPLVFLVLWMGIFPRPFIDTMQTTLAQLLAQVQAFTH